jgi:UDP-N-acetylglucosamine 2-epimerase (non-hydrolysing)
LRHQLLRVTLIGQIFAIGTVRDYPFLHKMMQAVGNDSPSKVRTILTLFGTRPEVIKLAPVIRQLEEASERYRTINVASGQHTSLVHPFVKLFRIRIDHDLRIMQPRQNPSGVCARVLAALDPILEMERPDLVLVQGDTTTALAGALAAFHHRIPVGHVEAGLRSGNRLSPFPEEMNRRLVTQLATLHFAATPGNRDVLVSEGVAESSVFITGNPVVDALEDILETTDRSAAVDTLLDRTEGLKRIVLTTHRRESFGSYMTTSLQLLRQFVETNDDVALLFPVHPNPVVVETTRKVLGQHPRIHLIEPLSYEEFVLLLSRAWLIVSDSGGIQEEAPTLGKPLIILRENTERPEAVQSGIARLVGRRPERLATLLQEAARADSWAHRANTTANPFGNGDAGARIVDVISAHLFDATPELSTAH